MTAWGGRIENPVSERLRDPATTGYVAVGLGAFAAFLAIPPIEARSPTWPIAVGIFAAALGIWTASRGRRRLGYGAVAGGLLGIGLGILATRSGTGNLETVFDATLVAQTFGFATPLVFGAVAGIFSERSGVVNIALEGLMLMGAFWGLYGSDKAGSWVVGLLVGMAAGGLLALLYAYFAIHLRADQIVGGTGINFLAIGITGYFFVQFYDGQVTGNISTVTNVHIPGLGHFLEGSIGDLSLLTWGSFVLAIARVHRALQDTDRAAHSRLWRASASRGHRRHQRLPGPVRLRRPLRDSSPRSAASISRSARKGTGRSSPRSRPVAGSSPSPR